MRSITCTGAFGATLLMTSISAASGLSTARFGGERGTPISTNPTAIYYNPGALSASQQDLDLFVDVNAAWRVASYERTPIPGCEAGADSCSYPREVPEPADAEGANNGSASLGNFAAAPMLGANLRIPFSEDFALAIAGGFFVPFGGQSTWNKSEPFETSRYPGAFDGAQRWWAIDGTLRTLFISGAIGAQLSKYFHAGVSAGAAITQVSSIRARTVLGNNDLTQEGRTWLDAQSVDAHLGAGVLVTPLGSNDLRIGLSYQLPVGLDYEAIKVRGLLAKKLGSGPVTGNVEGEDEVDMTVSWPDTIRFGVGYRFSESFEARLFGDYTFWSRNEENCISEADANCAVNEDGTDDTTVENNVVVNNVPRRWDDAFGLRAGISYWFNPDIELLVGAGYDGNAIPDATLAPDITDYHDVSLAVGGRYRFIDQLAANLTYTQFFYIDRKVSPEENRNAFFEGNSRGPSSHGEYSQSIGVVNLNLEVTFDVFDETPSAPPVEGEPEEEEGELPEEADDELQEEAEDELPEEADDELQEEAEDELQEEEPAAPPPAEEPPDEDALEGEVPPTRPLDDTAADDGL